MTLGESIRLVAPIYNLVLVAIVIVMFIILFKNAKKSYFVKPWKFLFYIILLFVFEEIMTVLIHLNVIDYPRIIHAGIEMLMVSFFIYALLSQTEYIDKVKKKR